MALIVVLAVSCATASLALFALSVLAPRRHVRAALARAAAYGMPIPQDVEAARRRLGIVGPLARLGRFLAPSTTVDGVALKLASAGLVKTTSAESYFALKSVLGLAGLMFGVLFGAADAGAGRSFVLAVSLGVAGFFAPDTLLNARVRRRREQILEELPNALDLLAVSVEAGLGIDAAVARYVDARSGPLADELGLLLAELRVGAGRHDVLRRLAERVPAAETQAFARAAIHADQLGTSLTQTLRTQAREARLRRQMAAEEKAGKAPVRMLIPTVFFIFPALFVVVLGPALLFLIKAF